MRVLPPPVSEATESFELEAISEELSTSALIPIPSEVLRPLPPPPSLPRPSYSLPPPPSLPPLSSRSTLPPPPSFRRCRRRRDCRRRRACQLPFRDAARVVSATLRRDTAPPVETTRVLPLTALGAPAGRAPARTSAVARAYVAALSGMVVGALFVVGLVKLLSDAPSAPAAWRRTHW